MSDTADTTVNDTEPVSTETTPAPVAESQDGQEAQPAPEAESQEVAAQIEADPNAQFNELVEGLKTISESLTSALGAAETNSESESEAETEPEAEEDQSEPQAEVNDQLTGIMASLKETLEPLSALLSGLTLQTAKVEPQEAPAQTGDTQLNALATAVNSLADMLKTQQTRLAQVEKNFGLPSSLPVGEQAKESDSHISWPIDLNNPVDRSNTHKEVSFHDVD